MSARTAALLCCLLASTPAAGAADVIKVEFLKNGRRTVAVAPGRTSTLLVVNPSAHRFRCTHLTQGLRLIVTPSRPVDVALHVQSEGRKALRPIDRAGAGSAEQYAGHPPLGKTTIEIRVKAGEGKCLVVWRWDPRCREDGR